jgi:hypothetical protein
MDYSLALTSFRFDNDAHWVEFVLKCTSLVSVNAMYSPGKARGGFFKTPEVMRFENELKDQIIRCDPVASCPWIINSERYGSSYSFILNHNFWNRDCTNLIKSPEDVIFKCLGINDARVVENHATKSFVEGKFEYLIAKIYLSKFDVYYFR